MKKKLQLALLCASVLACTTPATAQQKVYRCGSTYSQQPCPGGSTVLVEDERNAAQRAQTDKAAQRDAKAADAMEKARLKEEAKPAQAILPPPKTQLADEEGQYKPVSSKTKKPELFKASVPRKPGDTPPKKKKTSRKKRA